MSSFWTWIIIIRLSRFSTICKYTRQQLNLFAINLIKSPINWHLIKYLTNIRKKNFYIFCTIIDIVPELYSCDRTKSIKMRKMFLIVPLSRYMVTANSIRSFLFFLFSNIYVMWCDLFAVLWTQIIDTLAHRLMLKLNLHCGIIYSSTRLCCAALEVEWMCKKVNEWDYYTHIMQDNRIHVNFNKLTVEGISVK